MFPFFSIYDSAYVRTGEVELTSNILLHNAATLQATDFQNVCFCQFRVAAFFAQRGRIASLLQHILDIVRLRAKKEMGGIDATRIITLVTNQLVIWKITIGKLIRKTMGANDVTCTRLLQLPITFTVNRTLPLPTVVGAALVNFLPKAFYQWATRRWLMAA